MMIEEAIATLIKKITEHNQRLDAVIAALTAGKTDAAEPAKPAAAAATKPAPAKGKKGKAAAPSIDDVRALAVEVSKNTSEGKEKVVALLQLFGAERLAELDAERYAEFLERLVAIRDDGADPREAEEPAEGEAEDELF